MLPSTTCQLYIVGIGGSSCSGKSSLTRHLANLLAWPVYSLAMDDFFVVDSLVPMGNFLCSPELRATEPRNGKRHYKEKILEQHPDGSQLIQWSDWDSLDAIDWPDYNSYISKLASLHSQPTDPAWIEALLAQPPFKKQNSITRSSPSFSTVTKIILIIEGFLIFHPRTNQHIFDTKLWLRLDYDTCRSRRQRLATIPTKEGLWDDPPGYFELAVWPRYIEFLKLLQASPDFDSFHQIDTRALSEDAAAQKALYYIHIEE